MSSLDSFLQSGHDAALQHTAMAIGLAVIAGFMKLLARKDKPTPQSVRFAQSGRRINVIRWVAVLRLLLVAGLVVLLPRMHFDFSEPVEEAITLGTFFCAGVQIAISIYVWRYDRTVSRGAFLFVVFMGLGYALISFYRI